MNEVNEVSAAKPVSDLKTRQSHVFNSIIFPKTYQQMKNKNFSNYTFTITG